MQQLKTITVKTSNKVDSVHMETLYAVIQNCYNNLQVMEQTAQVQVTLLIVLTFLHNYKCYIAKTNATITLAYKV